MTSTGVKILRHPRRAIVRKVPAMIWLAAGLLACAGACTAQNYPSRYIRMIVPYVPGGGTDTLTRTIVPKLGEALGQQIIIDNRAGGSSAVGTEIAAKAAPDGYTLVMVDTSFTTNPALYGKLPF